MGQENLVTQHRIPILAMLTIGKGVERDKKKAQYYAARKGNVFARYNLGIREMKLKHAIWRGILNTSWFQWDLEMMALKLSMQQKTIMPKLYELTHHAYLSIRSRVLIGTKLLQSVIDSNIMNGTCQLSIKNQDTKEGREWNFSYPKFILKIVRGRQSLQIIEGKCLTFAVVLLYLVRWIFTLFQFQFNQGKIEKQQYYCSRKWSIRGWVSCY